MKHFNFKNLLIILMSTISNYTFAYDIAVENEDGVTIYYNWINDHKELEVTYREQINEGGSHGLDAFDGYDGIKKLTLPSTIKYKDKEYPMTSIGADALFLCKSLTSLSFGSYTISKIV